MGWLPRQFGLRMGAQSNETRERQSAATSRSCGGDGGGSRASSSAPARASCWKNWLNQYIRKLSRKVTAHQRPGRPFSQKSAHACCTQGEHRTFRCIAKQSWSDPLSLVLCPHPPSSPPFHRLPPTFVTSHSLIVTLAYPQTLPPPPPPLSHR